MLKSYMQRNACSLFEKKMLIAIANFQRVTKFKNRIYIIFFQQTFLSNFVQEFQYSLLNLVKISLENHLRNLRGMKE